MDWQLAAQFGVPFLILVAVGIWFYRSLWPDMVDQRRELREQLEKTADKREIDTERFLNELGKRDEENRRRDDRFIELIQNMSKESTERANGLAKATTEQAKTNEQVAIALVGLKEAIENLDRSGNR